MTDPDLTQRDRFGIPIKPAGSNSLNEQAAEDANTAAAQLATDAMSAGEKLSKDMLALHTAAQAHGITVAGLIAALAAKLLGIDLAPQMPPEAVTAQPLPVDPNLRPRRQGEPVPGA